MQCNDKHPTKILRWTRLPCCWMGSWFPNSSHSTGSRTKMIKRRLGTYVSHRFIAAEGVCSLCPAFEDSRSTLWPWGVMDSAPLVVGHFQGHPKDRTDCHPFACGESYVLIYWIYCSPPMNISDWKWNFQSRKCFVSILQVCMFFPAKWEENRPNSSSHTIYWQSALAPVWQIVNSLWWMNWALDIVLFCFVFCFFFGGGRET